MIFRYYPHDDSKFHYMKLLSVRWDVVSSGYSYVYVSVSVRDRFLSNYHTREVSSDYYDIHVPLLIPVPLPISVLDHCLYGCHRLGVA